MPAVLAAFVFIEDFNGAHPCLALAGVDLSAVKARAAALPGHWHNAGLPHDPPVAMLFAIFDSPVAFQAHDGSPCSRGFLVVKRAWSPLSAILRERSRIHAPLRTMKCRISAKIRLQLRKPPRRKRRQFRGIFETHFRSLSEDRRGQGGSKKPENWQVCAPARFNQWFLKYAGRKFHLFSPEGWQKLAGVK